MVIFLKSESQQVSFKDKTKIAQKTEKIRKLLFHTEILCMPFEILYIIS